MKIKLIITIQNKLKMNSVNIFELNNENKF